MSKLYAEAKLEKVTVTLTKKTDSDDPFPFYVMSRENVESYVPRWYTANFETFSEAMDNFTENVKEAESGERPWGTGGNLAGALSA